MDEQPGSTPPPLVREADAGAPGIGAPRALVTSLRRSEAATPYRFRDLLALDDFERHARALLPPMIFQYVAGAVETGAALARSRGAYADHAFLPRVLVDTAARHTRTRLFGADYAAPFGVAPIGGAAVIAYRGDVVLAEAARAVGVPMTLSASSLIPLETVHAANPDAWFQGYLPGDQARIDALLDRVGAAGYGTFVVTADVPVLGNREHNTRSGFSMPIRITPGVAWQAATHPRWLVGTVARTVLRHGAPHFENMEAGRGPPMMSRGAIRNTLARDALAWSNVEAIRRRWPGRLIVKGILHPADAVRARETGVDGIVLSSHGGRQLDHAVAPLDVLPEIAADKGEMAVLVDSGIRRGTDVLKALALGADFVLLGRPFIFAAALGGVPGVVHAMTLLRDEIVRDMALLGINRLSELGPDVLRRLPTGRSGSAAGEVGSASDPPEPG